MSPFHPAEVPAEVPAKRLWLVEVKKILFVVAPSSEDAERLATRAAARDGVEVDSWAFAVYYEDQIPDEHRAAIPYGAEPGDERTVIDWFRAAAGKSKP